MRVNRKRTTRYNNKILYHWRGEVKYLDLYIYQRDHVEKNKIRGFSLSKTIYAFINHDIRVRALIYETINNSLWHVVITQMSIV